MQLITLDFFRKTLGNDLPSINVLDVGASGGIDNDWRIFEPNLNALGIDPLVSEVDRLNTEETNKNVRYHAAFVKWSQWEEKYPQADRTKPSNISFERTSAFQAPSFKTFVKDSFNSGAEVVYSDEDIEIDGLVELMPEHRIDFLKTDTDGFDFPALLSGEKILSSDQVLALKVEANLHGPAHPYANNFANIDTYLRSKGFTLIKLETYDYSRSAFPAEFVYDIPAQTHGGAIQWGDAYYFRDFCNRNFEEIHGWSPSKSHIIRMAMLLEYLGQVDTLVELLLNKASLLDLGDEHQLLLDSLVVKYSDPKFGTTYDQLISNFQNDYTMFYPRREA